MSNLFPGAGEVRFEWHGPPLKWPLAVSIEEGVTLQALFYPRDVTHDSEPRLVVEDYFDCSFLDPRRRDPTVAEMVEFAVRARETLGADPVVLELHGFVNARLQEALARLGETAINT